MPSRPKLVIAVVLGLLPSLAVATAEAQARYGMPYQRKPAQQMPQVQTFNVTGKIEAVARGMIKLVTDSKQVWLVKIGPRTEVSVRGQVTEDLLRNGALVSATAELDSRGRVLSPVARITILGHGPKAGVVPGVFPNQERGRVDKPAGAADGPREQPATKAGTMFDLVGLLGRGKRGRYVLNTGRTKAEFELATDVVIDLDVADYSLAQKGDKVTCMGLLGSDGKTLVALARTLTIELAPPLDQTNTTTPKRPATHQPRNPRTQEPGAAQGEKPAGPGDHAPPGSQPVDAPEGPELKAP